MSRLNWIIPVLTVVGLAMLTSAATRTPLRAPPDQGVPLSELEETIQAVNEELAVTWKHLQIEPAAPADDLAVLRRLSLALHGTVPSLEEIRLFEADSRPERLRAWTDAMLEDNRFDDYFAERLARSFVGVENGQFLIFRRDRFLGWLRGQLKEHVPYDRIVREMIRGEGVWTGEGEVNFITAGFADGKFDPNQLTARTSRAFLGQRIDCAQCHDHPFDHWKQAEFEGLAAFYGQVSLAPLGGIFEKESKDLVIQDRLTLQDRTIDPAVPFHPEWLGTGGTRREQLARWITHPENQRFEIATANRIWGLLFGRPFAMDRSVDDLPDPGTNPQLKILEILGRDFREHGYSIRRMVRVITASRPFRMKSTHALEQVDPSTRALASQQLDAIRDHWGIFPLIRLRPEQVIGSMLQADSLRTIDQNSHLFTRVKRYFSERDFVEEFGDPGVDELRDYTGTIPQALLRMNGNFARDLTEARPLSAAGRIAANAADPEQLIATTFLVCLTREPDADELDYFRSWFDEREDGTQAQATEDLYWTLFNSPEFSWNH
jgi:hypothetical protein